MRLRQGAAVRQRRPLRPTVGRGDRSSDPAEATSELAGLVLGSIVADSGPTGQTDCFQAPVRTCEAEARGLQVFAILAGRSSCNLQEVPLSPLRLSLPLPLRQRQREPSERTERHHPRTTPAIPFPREYNRSGCWLASAQAACQLYW